MKFIGAYSYALRANWIGGLTVFGDGVPVGFFFRPISVTVGAASPQEIDEANTAKSEYISKMLGIKL
jgi:hypothetical protein